MAGPPQNTLSRDLVSDHLDRIMILCFPFSHQVGCMIHELMCGRLPFEAEDKHLSAALILWADVTYWPDTISPECISFIQVGED